jgi:hypothetical protein
VAAVVSTGLSRRLGGTAFQRRAVKTTLAIGGVLLVHDQPLVLVDGEPLLGMRAGEDGTLLLSLRFYDENDALLVEIVDNEWRSGDPRPWDIESSWQKLTIRSAHYKVALRLNAKSDPLRISGKLRRGAAIVEMTSEGLRIDHEEEGSLSIRDLTLVRMPLSITRHEGHTEIGGGGVVSDLDPVRRLEKSVAAFHRATGSGRYAYRDLP